MNWEGCGKASMAIKGILAWGMEENQENPNSV
jgi:hypothetical protein